MKSNGCVLKNLLLSVVCIFCTVHGMAEEWTEDYQAAQQLAEQSSQPMVIAILGDSSCLWSQKFELEVLSHPEFKRTFEGRVVLVKTYAPQLREKFHVKEVPSLILIDPSQREISRMGYLPLSHIGVATYLEDILVRYQHLQEVLEHSDLSTFKTEELEACYLQAKNLGCLSYRDLLLQMGLKKDKGIFFLVEKYTQLLEERKGRGSERKALRDEILNRDPQNKKGGHFSLALLEFQSRVNGYRKKNDPKEVIKPLVSYLRKFGKEDSKNIWRVEMMIAEFLFSKNCISEALSHAKASYDAAPEEVKPQIIPSLEYLQSSLK